jgi:hypothetical protein
MASWYVESDTLGVSAELLIPQESGVEETVARICADVVSASDRVHTASSNNSGGRASSGSTALWSAAAGRILGWGDGLIQHDRHLLHELLARPSVTSLSCSSR